jgi:hypothetical protein
MLKKNRFGVNTFLGNPWSLPSALDRDRGDTRRCSELHDTPSRPPLESCQHSAVTGSGVGILLALADSQTLLVPVCAPVAEGRVGVATTGRTFMMAARDGRNAETGVPLASVFAIRAAVFPHSHLRLRGCGWAIVRERRLVSAVRRARARARTRPALASAARGGVACRLPLPPTWLVARVVALQGSVHLRVRRPLYGGMGDFVRSQWNEAAWAARAALPDPLLSFVEYRCEQAHRDTHRGGCSVSGNGARSCRGERLRRGLLRCFVLRHR